MQIAKSLDVHSVELHRSPPTMVQVSVPFLVLRVLQQSDLYVLSIFLPDYVRGKKSDSRSTIGLRI
jgi:hypothetical protein